MSGRCKRFAEIKDKYLGKILREVEIVDVFYGPDRGYKNKVYYFSYVYRCGHKTNNICSFLIKNNKKLECYKCLQEIAATKRQKEKTINGVLKRSPIYNYWLSLRKKVDENYKDYKNFKDEVGEKPFSNSKIIVISGKPRWTLKTEINDKELNLIANAIRNVFHYSKNYKDCKEKTKVKTKEGIRYKCEICNELFEEKDMQMDHKTPIQPLDGSPLTRENLIDKIWDSPIQYIDRQCHVKKTWHEFRIRKNSNWSIK